MQSSLVTGATGLIGSMLLRSLAKRNPSGSHVALVRKPEALTDRPANTKVLAWDSDRPVPESAMDGVGTVFHLAGDPVSKGRWTDAKKKRIRDSRVLGTRHIVDAIRAAKERPRVLVSASAVGYYGSRGDDVLTEESRSGADFLAEVCEAWEAEAEAATALGVRVVRVRIGVVVAREGGALDSMLPIFRAGMGGPMGDGKQWLPWVHVRDVLGMLFLAAENERIRGALNVVSPHPVSNHDFSKALGAALHRPAFVPAPAFALRLALGEFASALLGSQRAVPTAALAANYAFEFEHLGPALKDILG